jgi:murein DD-endopeptidase MepM/ murein hydrolase activator NlpD
MFKKKLNEIITITIADNNDNKSFTLKKWIPFLLLFIFVLSLVLNTIIIYFSDISTNITKTKIIESKTIEIYNQKTTIDDMKLITKNLKNEIKQLKKSRNKKIDITKYIFNNIPNGSPLKNIKILGNFGFRVNKTTGNKKYFNALELDAKIGTKIYATADGIVRYARDIDEKSYGKAIIISHNFGFETVYAHMNSINFKLGDIVKKGQIVGEVGSTGDSRVPNLHYGIRYATKVYDPMVFINWNSENYESIFKSNLNINFKEIQKLIERQLNMVK